MNKDLILPVICNKYNISYILFSKDLKIFEFTNNMNIFVEEDTLIQKGVDVREIFWEFIGLEDSLSELYNSLRVYIHIPTISRNEIFYDVNIEVCEIDSEKYFIAMFTRQLNGSISYLKTIQKINQDSLIKYQNKKKTEEYYDAINRKLISFKIDQLGIIQEVNEACKSFFGLSNKDFIGKHFSEFFYSRENKLNSVLRAKNFKNLEVFFHADTISLSNEDSNKIVICQDITYLKQIESKLEYAVNHDSLTGLANRVYLLEKIKESIEKSKENNSIFVLCFIDLNKFKEVNDKFGHTVGDMLLKHVADILLNASRESDTVARWGGDEFIILLENIETADYLDQAILRIKQLSNKNPLFYNSELVVNFSFSLGISIYPYDGTTAEELLEKADNSMYLNKQESC